MNGIENEKRKTFDAFCKRLLKNETIDDQRERERQSQREIVFSDLTKAEKNQLQYIDEYAPDRCIFTVLNTEIEISNSTLVQALSTLSTQCRDIILLSYLLDMPDTEISLQLSLNRSTIQYQRTSTLAKLRKLMEDYDHE